MITPHVSVPGGTDWTASVSLANAGSSGVLLSTPLLTKEERSFNCGVVLWIEYANSFGASSSIFAERDNSKRVENPGQREPPRQPKAAATPPS